MTNKYCFRKQFLKIYLASKIINDGINKLQKQSQD